MCALWNEIDKSKRNKKIGKSWKYKYNTEKLRVNSYKGGYSHNLGSIVTEDTGYSNVIWTRMP